MTKDPKISKEEQERNEAELEGKEGENTGNRTPTDAEQKLVELAVKRYAKYMDDATEEITKAKDDISFCVDGDHWTVSANGKTQDLKAERDKDGRLTFTKNRAPGFIDNVTGEVRQNMPRIKFRPTDSGTDPNLAEIYNSAINYMQSISRAHRQYIPAFEMACTAGYPGWVQLRTDYATDDPMNDEQDIFVRLIPSQFGPALDPTATVLDRPDKGGPKWGIIPENISWPDYQKRFPEASAKSWDDVKETKNSWFEESQLKIASYYVAVPTYDTRYDFEDGKKLLKSSAEYKEYRKTNPDAKPKKNREVITWRIEHYLINGSEVLQGPEPWLGKFIPLIPFEGKWFMDNGKKKYRSVYREAKDANRLENWMDSTIAELLADEPYMATPEMIGEHEDMWKTRNKKKYGVLYYEHDQNTQGGRPTKEDNSAKLSNAFAMKRQLVDDEKSLTNIFNASRGEADNETSGRAINARDQQSNTTNFAFVDNGIVSPLEYIGMQFIDLFPKVYDYEKTLKIIGDDERESGEVQLNKIEPGVGKNGVENRTVHIIKNKKGEIVQKLYADLSKVRFDITVDVGPGMKTQRMEAADNIVRLSQGNPAMSEIGGDLLAKSMDFQYADELSKRYEFVMNQKYPGLLEATQGDGNPQASVQAAVKKAVEEFQAQIMPGIQQSADALEQLQAKVQQTEQEKAALEQQVQQATQAMKDAATKYEQKDREHALNLREHKLEMREKAAATAKGPGEGKGSEMNEIQELQAQVKQLADSVAKLAGVA